MMKKKTQDRGVGGSQWTANWSEENAIQVETLTVEATPEYVAWIDLMGAKGWMAGPIRRAAEIIGIIHLAGLRAANEHGARAYPVIDGVYLVSEGKRDFTRAVRAVMRTLALTFLSRKQEDRFLVRGGIAYGRVLHGDAIAELHDDLKRAATYSKCLALGISIGQAYSAEGKAPPFGYHVDMTARSTASVDDSPYISSFYRWWSASRTNEVKIARDFGVQLDNHFEHLRGKRREIEYPCDSLDEHRAIAREYFRLSDEDVHPKDRAEDHE